MRDSFDHYFSGWSLFSDSSPAEKTEFAALVTRLERALAEDPNLAEAWRVHPFDGKKDAFLMVFHRFAAQHPAEPAFAAVAARLQSTFPAPRT
jgi:hypothetical protein